MKPLFITCPWLTFFFSWSYSRYPEGVTFELLRREIEKVVGIQIEYEPDPDNYAKQYESRAVLD
ncbi:MAG: hypothetical protein ACERKY_09770, partial [Anaerolineales bacterium]